MSTRETSGNGRQEHLRAEFETLYVEHFDRLYDFCLRTVADPDTARDAVQETFARAWQERQRGAEIVYPKAWLFRVARNVCIDEIRRRKGIATGGRTGEEAMFSLPDVERQVNPETATVDAELRVLVWSAARGLGPRDYSLLDMHLRQELSIEEIAGALGAKPGAVYTMLSRLRDAVESAVGAEVLRRNGECETLARLVGGRELDRKLRSEIDAHVQACAECSERRRRMVAPAAIFAGLAPVVAPEGLQESIWRSGRLFAKAGGTGRLTGTSRGRLVGLAATAAAAMTIVAAVVVFRSGSADAVTVKSGYVFLGGTYVEPPYAVETHDGEVRLNGQTVWRQDGPPSEVPPVSANPGNASEAVDAGGTWLSEHRAKDQQWVSDGLAAELKRYVEGLGPVASVDDDGFTLTVTDRDGETAELAYRSMIPIAEDVRKRADLEAKRLTAALKSGDVLLISAGVMMDVPAGTANGFLGMIAGSLGLTSRDAQSERLARILPPAISEDLVAAGSPEAALRRRLPDLAPQEPPVPQQETASPVVVGPSNGRAPLDLTAFPDGHVPGSDNAIFWLSVTFETSTSLEPVRQAVSLHEYKQITFDRSWVFGNGRKLQASQFVWALAHAGVFYISAHGSPSGIEIDRYWCEKPSVFCPGGSAQEALTELRKTVPAEVEQIPASSFSPARTRTREIGSIERSSNGAIGDVQFPTSWGLWVNTHEIELLSKEAMKQGAARNILLELSACSSIDLAPHFLTADDVVAGAETLIVAGQGWREDDMADFNTQFWPRMSGVLGQGSKRWVQAAFDDSPPTKYERHGSGLTMLSPVVKAETPDRGATIPVGVEIPVTVRFATKMDQRFADAQINLTLVEGDCKPEKTDFERWLDDHTLTFHIIARKEGTMLVRVKGAAESGENFVRLDGNSATDGAPSGVGANTDDFVWRLSCRNGVPEVPGQAVSPTPSATIPRGAAPGTTASKTPTGDATSPGDAIQPPTQPLGGTGGGTTTPGTASETPATRTPSTTPSPTEATSTTPPPPTATTPAPPLVTGPYAGSLTVPPGGDPAGHSCCVKPSSSWDVRQVRDTSTNIITITLSGVLPGISLSSAISGTGAAFTATTTGVVAGFANVSVTFSGSVTPQTGIQGTLVVGGNGALPQGKSITFNVNMAKK